MNINIKNQIQETTVREVAIEVLRIPNGSDKIEVSGDILYIIGNFPEIEDLIVQLNGASEWEGSVVLAEGDGYKVIQSRGIYTAYTRCTVGGYVNVAGEHRFYPGIVGDFLEGLWNAQMVGYRVYMINGLLPPPSEIDFRISSVGEDGTGKYFVFSDYTNGPLGPNIEFWFAEDHFTSEFATTSIKLVTGEASLVISPDSTIDVQEYWNLIRTVWDNLEDEDRGLVEEMWQGSTEDVGNLLQRLYEIESATSVRDILIFRKNHWSFVDADHRRYKFQSGYTDRNNPTHFYDKEQSPFRMKNWPHEAHDEGLYLTVEGQYYEIEEVIAPWEVVLKDVEFETKKNLSYSVGGINDDDLRLEKIALASSLGLFNSGELLLSPSGAQGFYISHNSHYLFLGHVNKRFLYRETVTGEKGSFILTSPINQTPSYPSNRPPESNQAIVKAFLSREDFFDLGITDIHKIDVLGGTGLVRLSQSEFGNGYIRAVTPTVFYCEKPIFTRAYKGTWITVDSIPYRVSSVASDGYSVTLPGAAFSLDQENVKFAISPYDYSQWDDGTTNGTDIFIGSAVEEPFDSDYVERTIFIGGLNNDFFTIKSFIDSKTVTLDRVAIADVNVTWQLPADAIVDLGQGLIRRTGHGIIRDASYLDVTCHIRTMFRIYADTDLAELPTLQETVRLPEGAYTDVMTKVASSFETYLGHRNLTEAVLNSQRGVRLTQDVDYTVDLTKGEIKLLNNTILTGESFQAVVSYSPYYGKQDIDYFLGNDNLIHFKDCPRHILWAEASYLNKEDPYKKYGELISFYQENSSAYHLALLALWTTYWIGPRPDYIERGLNILLGLPFAERAGVVEYTALRRVGLEDVWVVVILYDDGIRSEYELPGELHPFVQQGEVVAQFDILAGYSYEHLNSGKTLQESYRKTVIDEINNPFNEKFVGGKLSVTSGLNEGIYSIVSWKDQSRVIIDNDLLKDEDFSFVIKVPAVRIFDQTNYENFIDEVGDDALSKYFTQNTTAAEQVLARTLLKRHLFISQAEPPAFSAMQNILDVFTFLTNIKPQYTDFIFQVLIEQDEELEFGEEELSFDFDIDLTSTFSWWAGLLRSAVDPFTGAPIINTYPSYRGASVAGITVTDAVNSPFVLDDVGRYFWINTAYKYYENGATTVGDTLFTGPVGTFTIADENRLLHVPIFGVRSPIKIVEFLNSQTVRVAKAFAITAAGLDFHVQQETQQGVYEIVAFISATQIQIDTVLVAAAGIHYSLIDNIELLDEEALALFDCGEIEVYDSLMALIETISLGACPP